jgi:endonuclease/exonuclease/phosphatase family metal-dependent hydrolase
LKASSNFHEERKNQLKQIISFQDTPNFIIFGDLNIHNSKDEKNIKQLSLFDCWSPSNIDNQFTFNAEVNQTIQAVYFGCEDRKMRLDRFLLSKNSIYQPSCPLQLFADSPYTQILTNNQRHPSDHFGICVKISKFNSNL